MLIVSDVSYMNQGKMLLSHVSFTLDRERKVIIGENGCGKTTLLEIIVGNLSPYTGSVTIKGSFAYLPQEVQALETTGMEEIERVFHRIKTVERLIEELERRGDYGKEYGELLEHYADIGGYSYRQRILEVANSFGLCEQTLRQKLKDISGGERTKVELVKAILSESDFLILDEPTNHLDVETIEALEEYLLNYRGGLLIVSHDRSFINNIATHILYIERGMMKEYAGSYDKFEMVKSKEDQFATKERERLLKYVEEQRKFIEKFRYGTRSKQALSREKAIEKIEIPDPLVDRKRELKIEQGKRGGEIVLDCKGIKKSFDGNEVLKGVNLSIRRGERVGILGRNGSGKTTLLKIIAGVDKNFEGNVRVGESIEIGYFPQDSFMIDDNVTPLDEIIKEGLTVQESRDFLSMFDLRGDDVFKKISEFSGGEKRKLILAKMSLVKGNFLVMDEPTNHLDIEMNQVVMNALKNFDGSILLVTHDRYLLKELTNKVYYLEDGILNDREKILKRVETKSNEEKEKNKIKARIEYLERLLSREDNEKRSKELKILKARLQKMNR